MIFVEETHDPTLAVRAFGPELPDECGAGWYSHTWTLTIEEGQPTVASGCLACDQGFGTHALAEGLVEMYEPLAVTLEHHVEHQADNTYWWWELVPKEKP